MPGNEVANLRENAELRFGGWLFVFYKTDPKWDRPPATTFFTSGYGMPVDRISKTIDGIIETIAGFGRFAGGFHGSDNDPGPGFGGWHSRGDRGRAADSPFGKCIRPS